MCARRLPCSTADTRSWSSMEPRARFILASCCSAASTRPSTSDSSLSREASTVRRCASSLMSSALSALRTAAALWSSAVTALRASASRCVRAVTIWPCSWHWSRSSRISLDREACMASEACTSALHSRVSSWCSLLSCCERASTPTGAVEASQALMCRMLCAWDRVVADTRLPTGSGIVALVALVSLTALMGRAGCGLGPRTSSPPTTLSATLKLLSQSASSCVCAGGGGQHCWPTSTRAAEARCRLVATCPQSLPARPLASSQPQAFSVARGACE
mmetsp:Transcript_16615/g.49908  ORF Transcript_16615/g.49908 Transcript_16615/m.49908 type:complete len:276 (-) Transcript_16615:904-1731(-)